MHLAVSLPFTTNFMHTLTLHINNWKYEEFLFTILCLITCNKHTVCKSGSFIDVIQHVINSMLLLMQFSMYKNEGTNNGNSRLFRPLLHHLADKDYVPLQIHFHTQFHWPTPSLENARFQWLVHQSGTLCQQTFGTLQTSLNSSVISRPTFLASILILSHAFVFICFSGFRLYIELCNTPVDSFCN